MEIKTCEDFVLHLLDNTLTELDRVKEENAELRETLAKSSEMNTVVAAGVYYWNETCAYYKYNDVLKHHGKDPAWLRDVLTDDALFDEFLTMTTGHQTYWEYHVYEGQCKTYNYLFTAYNEQAVIMLDMSSSAKLEMEYIDNKTYFLDKDACEAQGREDVRHTIEEYFERGADAKFKEDE